MIKNIILLTKISTRNFLENYDLFKKDERKINKKSIYFWLILIVIIAIILIVIGAIVGNYIQQNKEYVKDKIKAFIDRI